MTFKEYKAKWGKDGYCSLGEIWNIRVNSNPRSYRAILKHWEEAVNKQIKNILEDWINGSSQIQ